MKKFLMTIIFIIYIFSMNIISYSATNEQTLKEQQEEFKIQDFIKGAKQYTGEFFEDIEIEDVLEQAIEGKIDNNVYVSKILRLFGKEVTKNITTIVSILTIIVIHSILKSISESLENNGISKLIYYVQYILIVTIIMSNFSDIIKIVQDTMGNLLGFMNILIPLLITLVLYTGSISTSSIIEPLILFMINFIGNIILNIIIPLVLIFASLAIISKISDGVQIDKLSKFFKSGIIWFLSIILTIFVGVVSLEGTLASSIDGVTAKTRKSNCKFSNTHCRKDFGRCSRYSFRLWHSYKKWSWYSWNYYNIRNLHNSNIKAFSFYNII